MATTSHGLDPRQKPPEQLRVLFKKYQRATKDDLECDSAIIDTRDSHLGISSTKLQFLGVISSAAHLHASVILSDREELTDLRNASDLVTQHDAPIYQVQALPGLHIIPSLLSPDLQIEMLNKLLHRDLANSTHKTNLHLHYKMDLREPSKPDSTSNSLSSQENLPYERSFFCKDPSTTLQPNNPLMHKELSFKRALEKKLRWVTLGGQYDWTAKEYPRERPPSFPADIAGVLKSFFPQVDPQAAILNFYSPSDTLSVHRDVSEESDQGLISLSFGCDAIFVVGNEDGSKTATIRLRSGDALLMSSPSRFAWHGVPKVLAWTCPEWLAQWPMLGENGSAFQQWKGWMAGKRINLNVRQMRENSTTGVCGSLSSAK